VRIAEHGPELEGRQQVPLDVEVAVHVGLGHPQLVERGHGGKALLGDDPHGEGGLAAVADRMRRAVRQTQLEGPDPAVPGAQLRVALPQACDQGVVAGRGVRGCCGGRMGEIAHRPPPSRSRIRIQA
jgi:hypothetical protein